MLSDKYNQVENSKNQKESSLDESVATATNDYERMNMKGKKTMIRSIGWKKTSVENNDKQEQYPSPNSLLIHDVVERARKIQTTL